MPVIDHFKLRVGASAVRAVYHGDVVLSGPTLDLDFLIQRYVQMTAGKNFADIITFTRASAATRINALGVLESVAANVPRIDYNPVTLACRGLLIEEQRTNLILSSAEPFSFWGLTGATKTLAPSSFLGFSNGAVVASGGANWNRIGRTGISLTSGVTYAFSVYLAAGTSGRLRLVFRNAGGNESLVYGPIAPTFLTSAAAGAITYSLLSIGSGFILVGTFTPNSTASHEFSISPDTDTVGANIVVFSGQLEAGAFHTSFITTGGAQATRAASDCKISTLSPWFSQQGGVLLLDYLPMGGDGVVAEFHNTANNRWGVTRAANGDMTAATVSAGTADGSAVVAGASPAGQIRRAAVSLAANDLRISVNGGAVSKDASVSLPVNLSVLQLGARQGLTTPFNGWLRKVRYIPKPVASDAELQALSTI